MGRTKGSEAESGQDPLRGGVWVEVWYESRGGREHVLYDLTEGGAEGAPVTAFGKPFDENKGVGLQSDYARTNACKRGWAEAAGRPIRQICAEYVGAMRGRDLPPKQRVALVLGARRIECEWVRPKGSNAPHGPIVLRALSGEPIERLLIPPGGLTVEMGSKRYTQTKIEFMRSQIRLKAEEMRHTNARCNPELRRAVSLDLRPILESTPGDPRAGSDPYRSPPEGLLRQRGRRPRLPPSSLWTAPAARPSIWLILWAWFIRMVGGKK